MNLIKRNTRYLGGLAAVLLFAALPQHVWAVASSTVVNTTATISYTVGSTAQPDINAAANFTVDKKVDVLVENLDGAAVTVSPGQVGVVLTFRVTNEGNDVQDILLTATALAGGAAKYGGTDNFDISTLKIYSDDGNGSWDGTGVETDITADPYIDELASGGTKVIYLHGTVPTSQTDGSIASYYLQAQVAVGGSASVKGVAEVETGDGVADSEDDVDIVFADGSGDNSDAARDGKHTLQGEWKVAGATLSVTKSSAVIDDYVSASNFKRIPGALIEYTIEIANSGSADAVSISITDPVDTTNVTFQADAYAAGKGLRLIEDVGGLNTTTDYTSATGDDVAEYNGSHQVTITGVTVPAGETVHLKFQVVIN